MLTVNKVKMEHIVDYSAIKPTILRLSPKDV